MTSRGSKERAGSTLEPTDPPCSPLKLHGKKVIVILKNIQVDYKNELAHGSTI